MSVHDARLLELVADYCEARRPRAKRAPEESEAIEDVVVRVESALFEQNVLPDGGRRCEGEVVPVVVGQAKVIVAFCFGDPCFFACGATVRKDGVVRLDIFTW